MAGIKIYAISYDDCEVLAEFSEKQGIPFPLLSDIDSEVIRAYGILNDQVAPEDGFFYGIPYPGVYVTDKEGRVAAKFFHGTYKKRDSAELLIAAATGNLVLEPDAPSATGGDDDIVLNVSLQGGRGNLRQGMVREIVVRFELPEGLHIYGEPVPEGMVATEVTIEGAPGLMVEPAVLPPTHTLALRGTGHELQVWSGTVDIRVPVYAASELATEVAPLAHESTTVDVVVRYQACDTIRVSYRGWNASGWKSHWMLPRCRRYQFTWVTANARAITTARHTLSACSQGNHRRGSRFRRVNRQRQS